jgi:hypothetical protein
VAGSGCCGEKSCAAHIAHYRFFVTFRGADFRHSIETQQSKIESPNFRLGSRKVTMNHIIDS